jgi:hypothetical protein
LRYFSTPPKPLCCAQLPHNLIISTAGGFPP